LTVSTGKGEYSSLRERERERERERGDGERKLDSEELQKVLLDTYLIYGLSEYNGSNDYMIVRVCLKRCGKNHGISENTI